MATAATSVSQQVRRLLESAVQSRIGSGMAAAWGMIDAPGSINEVYVGTEGRTSVAGRVTDAIDSETFFDLASLTKILSTVSVSMVANERGQFALDERADHGMTFGELLSHTSGLPAWKPIYEKLVQRWGENLPYAAIADRRHLFFQEALAVPPELKPRSAVVYSDFGFWHLQSILERRFSLALDRLAQDWVWSKIPNSRLHYRPVRMDSAGERYRIAATGEKVAMTEYCPWRGLLQGQVHDDNSWSMGGVSGHAGVFGRLKDVTGWVHALFDGAFVAGKTLRMFTKEVSEPFGARRTYGFDMVSLDGNGSAASAFSAQTVGHLGFTGTSVWMDLDAGVFAVLLTNRVHPDRSDTRIRGLRQQFHTLVRS
ncbi:MAG: beta-lactamase family protein [Bdellovibrionales bacterium]|nr:beta-lactamase family protein [Bdellovibrionales bacterium]